MPQALPAIGGFLGATGTAKAAVGALAASTALGLGSNVVLSQRQQKASERIASTDMAQRQALAQKQRVSEVNKLQQERQASRTSNRLKQASAMGIRNSALRSRGIAPRSTGRFPQVTANVLDEGANG